MSLSTTIVACSVGVVFPCLPVVSVVVVIVGFILIAVCTLILVLSVVHILVSVWNVAIWVTGHCGFQCWALVCYFYESSVDLLAGLGYGNFNFESNCIPITLAILVIGCQCQCYEGVCVSILSCVDYE